MTDQILTTAAEQDDLELPENARALLDAVVAISSDLDLHSVLLRIVVSACQITQAKYGALGVIGHGGGLVDFVTHGIDESEHAKIGNLPRGHGILGLLIDHPEPIRLRNIQDHPKSYGFPPNHPPMERFLGVPVRIRGTVFGNLYLTEKEGGGEFTAQDERLVMALASAAGFVIENARDYAQSERRRQWLEATAQINDALQPPVRLDDALRQIAIGARRVSGASAVAVVRRGESGHDMAAWDGRRSQELATLVTSLETHIAGAEEEATVVVVPQGAERTVVLVPLRAHLAPDGVLMVVLDAGRGSLESDEAELLASFADQAALALDRAQAISDRQELMLVSDRDRIARDLHDLVIQRLFATGLQLQGARRIAQNDEVKERIDVAVADLDVTIRDIRSTIFELQHGHELSLRADVRGLVKEYVPVLGFTPMVRTSGPLDTAVPTEVAEQLLAVLREALSNVARHAEADAAVVEVEARADEVMLRVADNGKGLPPDRHESGLRNARRRAADNGGSLRLVPEEPHGTVLEWTVPLRIS
ncbi:MAG TPA: GAF domain-containing sensor histidine kinase [Nocardioidaceae bacterium]|nr:GAF domain-containing sensor histidine kinase [Nocardioidaceae bacterium]